MEDKVKLLRQEVEALFTISDYFLPYVREKLMPQFNEENQTTVTFEELNMSLTNDAMP